MYESIVAQADLNFSWLDLSGVPVADIRKCKAGIEDRLSSHQLSTRKKRKRHEDKMQKTDLLS